MSDNLMHVDNKPAIIVDNHGIFFILFRIVALTVVVVVYVVAGSFIFIIVYLDSKLLSPLL